MTLRLLGSAAALTTAFIMGGMAGPEIFHRAEPSGNEHAANSVAPLNLSTETPAPSTTEPSIQTRVHRAHSRNPAPAEAVPAPEVDQSILVTWEQDHPDEPPADAPHLTDEHFFGDDPQDPEVVKLRETALAEHIDSLREAGLPEEDIQAVIDVHRDELEQAEVVSLPIDEDPVTPEVQEEELALSLMDAGESEQLIAQMTNEFWDDLDRSDERADLASMADNVNGHGLDHHEPQRH